MGLFSGNVEHKTQLYFHDDGSFQFRNLQVEEACLVEKEEGKFIKAWKHFHGGQLRFDGRKGVFGAAMVSLGFDRDVILDPFNRVPVLETPGGKPAKTDTSIRKWLALIGESQRHKIMSKPTNMLLIEKITIILGVLDILMLLGYLALRKWG